MQHKMINIDTLKRVVHIKGISRTDIALLCVATNGTKPATAKDIRTIAIEAGVKGAKKIVFSPYLSSASDKVFSTPKGWELTDKGRKHIDHLVSVHTKSSPATIEAHTLRSLLPKLKNALARDFIEEAILCAEKALFRAAVVLSWAGAVAVLQDYIVRHHLSAFNLEAPKYNNKWRPAKTTDDLNNIKEYELIQILHKLSIIGKNTKQELEQALKLRNACGHPSTLKIGANKAAAHIELLVLNVFIPFVK